MIIKRKEVDEWWDGEKFISNKEQAISFKNEYELPLDLKDGDGSLFLYPTGGLNGIFQYNYIDTTRVIQAVSIKNG